MNTGRPLAAVVTEINRRAGQKRDFVADTRTVFPEVVHGARLQLSGIEGTFGIQPWAHSQIAEHCGIPQAYYDRTLKEAPSLWQENVRHWMAFNPSRHLVRTLDGQVRAWLSDRYRPLDNEELAEAALPVLEEVKAEIVSAEVTDRRLYIKALDPKLRGFITHTGHDWQRFGEDEVVWGICITNSEVGAGRLAVSTFFVRSVCSNAAIVESVFGQFHLGSKLGGPGGNGTVHDAEAYLRDETRRQKDKALFMEMRDVVRGALTETQMRRTLTKLNNAASHEITGDIPKVVEVTGRRFGLGEGERASILRNLINGGDLTAWGLANALTATAGDTADYDRATELERAGMQVIELPARDWEAIATAN